MQWHIQNVINAFESIQSRVSVLNQRAGTSVICKRKQVVRQPFSEHLKDEKRFSNFVFCMVKVINRRNNITNYRRFALKHVIKLRALYVQQLQTSVMRSTISTIYPSPYFLFVFYTSHTCNITCFGIICLPDTFVTFFILLPTVKYIYQNII